MLRSPIRCGFAIKRSRELVDLAPGSLTGMRLTEFHELVTVRFGAAYGASVLADHALTGFDGRTGTQAIEDGVDPRDVWRALCVDFDVPREQW